LLSGELNDLLSGENLRVKLPTGATTHPSSLSKSPLEKYGDEMISPRKKSSDSKQVSDNAGSGSFDEELKSFEDENENEPEIYQENDVFIDTAHIRDLIVKSVTVTQEKRVEPSRF
jgi:hypothetical protein